VKNKLKKNSKIAVICANGVGDGLTWMVMAYHLQLEGHQVHLYSDVLYGMRSWFPVVDVRKQNKNFDDACEYDHILADDHSWFAREVAGINLDHRVFVPKESEFNRKEQRLFNMKTVLESFYNLREVSFKNGIQAPGDLVSRRHTERIVLHPTASDKSRYWGKKRFLKLARKLREEGYKMSFIVATEESNDWMDLASHGFDVPRFNSLSDVAEYIYESSFFIGSDSGLGHLASNLGIPTVSIFVRRSHSLNWRPGWSKGLIAAPLGVLPSRYLRQRIWRPLLTVSMVLNKFRELRECVYES
jgi:heptosyltransferase-3